MEVSRGRGRGRRKGRLIMEAIGKEGNCLRCWSNGWGFGCVLQLGRFTR